MTEPVTLTGARIFDGHQFRPGALSIEDGRIAAILPEGATPQGQVLRLAGGTLAPGLIDLQVNGGGGLQVGAGTTADDLAAICRTHAGLGATGILPTLITDRPEVTAKVIATGITCARRGADSTVLRGLATDFISASASRPAPRPCRGRRS